MDEGQQTEQPQSKPRFRDRLWSFKALLLVALATLIIGGLTGAGLTALASDDDPGRHATFEQGRPGMPYGPPRGGHKPWQHRHFYWNDGPMPADPGMPSPGNGMVPELRPVPREKLKDLEKRVEELEKKQAPKN